MISLTDRDIKRFWSKVLIVDDEDSCWPWQAATMLDGYGQFWLAVYMRLAHRIAYIVEHGSIPDDYDVLHTCDNPPCVRPDHIYAGTHQQNMTDMVTRKRTKHYSGDLNGMRLHAPKTTKEIANTIRELYSTGAYTQKSLGMRFKISSTMVWMIIHDRCWTS